MAFIDEIKDRLVAQGVGVYGTNILLGSKALIPAGDGPYLSITASGGSGSARTHNGTPVQRPTAQILVRAKTTPPARTMIDAAYAALGGDKGLHNITLGATFYQNIVPRQPPTDIGQDDAGRVMFAYNIEVERDGI